MNKTFSPLQTLVDSDYSGTYSYKEYIQLIEELHARGETTGHTQTEKYVEYSMLNEHRMARIYKKQELDEALVAQVSALTKSYTLLVITEAWCGDAAQNLPILERLAAHSDKLRTRYLLRDENPTIMDLFLTNGGRSIPVVVCIDGLGTEIFRWGPRPLPLQERVLEYKSTPEPKISYDEFAKENQLWYAKNKGSRFQEELKVLLDFLE